MSRVDNRSLLHLSRAMDTSAPRPTVIRYPKPPTAVTVAAFAATAFSGLFGARPVRAQAVGAPIVRAQPDAQLQLPRSYALRLSQNAGVISIVPNDSHDELGAWVADPHDSMGASLLTKDPSGQDVELAYVKQTDGATDPVSKKAATLLTVKRADGSLIGECWKVGKKFEFRIPPDAAGNAVSLKAEIKKDGRLVLGKFGSLGLVASADLGEPFEDVVVQRFDPAPSTPIPSTGPLTAAQSQEVLLSATAAYLHDMVTPPQGAQNQRGQKPDVGEPIPRQHWYTSPLAIDTAIGVGAIALDVLVARSFIQQRWCIPQYAHNYYGGPRVLPAAHNYYAGPGIPPAAHNPWPGGGVWNGGGNGPPKGGGGDGWQGGGNGPIKVKPTPIRPPVSPIQGGPVSGGGGWQSGGGSIWQSGGGTSKKP